VERRKFRIFSEFIRGEGIPVTCSIGRAIAEAVSRWLPIAAARVQTRVWSSGQSGAGAGFLRVLRFPLLFIPPNSPSSQSPGAGTIGQWVADVPSGPSLDSTPHSANLKKFLKCKLKKKKHASLNSRLDTPAVDVNEKLDLWWFFPRVDHETNLVIEQRRSWQARFTTSRNSLYQKAGNSCPPIHNYTSHLKQLWRWSHDSSVGITMTTLVLDALLGFNTA
jgi:hypothetical protein